MDHSLDEIKYDVLDLAVFVPVRGHAEEGDDIWRGPAIEADVNSDLEGLS